MKKNLAYYRRLPYTRRCQLSCEEGSIYWHAWVEELPGCEVDSQTKAGAFADLDEVFEDYLAAKLEWGSTIPEPTRWPEFNRVRKHSKTAQGEVRLLDSPVLPGPDSSNREAEEAPRTDETMMVPA